MFFDAANEQPVLGIVPSSYVRLLFDYLEQRGIDASALLGELPPQVGHDGLGRYPIARWRAHLVRAAEHLGDPQLGLHLGQTITPGHFGPLGYVLLACGNLGAAVERFQRYQRLLYDVSPMRTSLEGDTFVLAWGVERGRPGPLADECAITALVQFARDLSGLPAPPLAVDFVNPMPADVRPYEAYFGCPVRFEQTLTRVVFPLVYLSQPLRQPDPVLVGMLERQVEAVLAALPSLNDVEAAVRRQIAQLVREGEPSLERVAETLRLSPRTLHRRLQDSGLNFRALLEDTRRLLAEGYLRDRRLTLADVALLLGFSEQSAFNRAFKRWTGNTPRRWREQH